MKSLKKASIFLIIAVVLTVLLPATALAGVTGNNINTVSSKLGHLTSSNPSEGWAWGETPDAPYTATLSPETGFEMPADIIVWRVHYYSEEELAAIIEVNPDNLYTYIVKERYAQGTDYTYDQATGEIVIPVATLGDIAYSGSTDDIEIIANAYPVGAYISTAASVSSQLANLTSSRTFAMYPWGSTPAASFTATLSADAGHSLPSSIKVYKLQWYDPDTHQQIIPSSVAKVYAANLDYTYNASTGEIVIPVATLAEISIADSPYNILIVASGVANMSTYSITVAQTANGIISPASAINIPQGSNRDFTITPDAGFQITNVLVDGTSIGAVSSYTFTNIISNHTITATFEKTSAAPSPSATPSPSGDPLDEIPKAGDSSLSWIWWLLLGISVVGIVALIMIRKKVSLKQ